MSGREIIDAWDLKHFGRTPIAMTALQNKVREDLIFVIDENNEALATERDRLKAMCEELAFSVKVARGDERERIVDDLGNPGLEGCGSVTIETKYDEVLKKYEEMGK